MSKKVTLIPIAMIRPSSDCIQAPSAIRPSIEMTEDEFNEDIADTARASLVSLDADGLSNPQRVTAYTAPIKVSGGKGWLGRFIKK